MSSWHRLLVHLFLSLIFLIDSINGVDYTIRKISVAGIFTGKDAYKKLYHLHKGMIFNQAEHLDGIADIQKHLREEGYLQPRVDSACHFNDKDKSVTIELKIMPGPLFSIASVSCSPLPGNNGQADPSFSELFGKLNKRLQAQVKNKYCRKSLLDNEARGISAYFTKKGYLCVGIEMEQTFDYATHSAHIHFNCLLKDKKRLFFTGNKLFSSQQLYQVCAEFGKALLIIPPELIVQELKDFYLKQGYLEAKIIFSDQDSSMLVIDIDEGPHAFIEKVVVIGLESDAGLADTQTFFTNVMNHSYDVKKIEKSLQELSLFLVRQGYWKVSLEHTHIDKQASENYTLTVHIDPGPKLFINQITVDLFPDLIALMHKQPWCAAYRDLYEKKGCPSVVVDITCIRQMRKFLQKQLHARGYLYTHVAPQFVHQDGASTLHWQFTGHQEPVLFGDTHIKGSCVVPDEIILRSLPYKKGETWDYKKLTQTASLLRSWGVFDQVTIFPENIEQAESQKVLVLQVQDSDSYELRTRIGFQGVGTNMTWRGGGTYKFGGTFLWKNPRAIADIFSLELDITRFLRYVTMMYQLPFLGPLPIKQQCKGYSNAYEQPVVLGSREILYCFAQDGMLWALSQEQYGAKWGVTTGLEWMRISQVSTKLAQAINFTTRFVDKRIPYFFLEPSFYISDIDNRLDPSCGWYLVLSCKALAPFTIKNGASVKFLCDQGSYIPLHKATHMTLACRLRLGTILYQEFSTIMPPERFYLGGAYSLRGYEPDLAPPLNFYRNKNQEIIVVPTGGKTMMNGNFELRFTIFKSLGGTIFTDIGLLTHQSFTDIRAGDIMGASGFGLRWNTPVGPLRFDIGWRWRQLPENSWSSYEPARYAWFLTLGNAF